MMSVHQRQRRGGEHQRGGDMHLRLALLETQPGRDDAAPFLDRLTAGDAAEEPTEEIRSR